MNAFVRLLIEYILQMAFTLGIVFLFGKVIAVCNGRFYRTLGSKGRIVCYVSGFIGTPIHESAHALMCLFFGHKIEEIKFFQINSSDGTLGYVRHSYNPKNVWQRLGNLFIGVAPILVGAGLLCLLLYLLLPDMFAGAVDTLTNIDIGGNPVGAVKAIGKALVDMFRYADRWQWWVFLLSGSLIALHMTLSDADTKGALSGVIFFFLIFFAIDVVLVLINPALLSGFTAAIMVFGNFMIFFLCVFLFIALVLMVLAKVFAKILRL